MSAKSICPNLLWSILWLILFFFTWPLSFIVAIIEVIFIPLCACSESVKRLCEKLDRLFKILAFQPIDNMIKMRSCGSISEYNNDIEDKSQIPPELEE